MKSAKTLPPSNSPHHSSLEVRAARRKLSLGRAGYGKIRTPGSVRAKAEWLSCSTITNGVIHIDLLKVDIKGAEKKLSNGQFLKRARPAAGLSNFITITVARCLQGMWPDGDFAFSNRRGGVVSE